MSNREMKKFCILCVCFALIGFVSCQKQQTEEERKAEIDRQVEQRLAAERQAQEKEQLAQRQAELDAREKALADKENATATPAVRERSTSIAGATRGGPEEENSYNIFYTKLDPYGDWRETSDYGYVWQPREAERSRDWHPYTNGHWVYTDAGWMWVSDEPFGWATYHYGRWTRLRNVGWVWVPGDEWAPAWVSWRKSDEYVGWAPLPPEARFDRRRGIHNWADNYYDIGPDQYRFVPTRELGAQRIENTVVPRERNVTIINQTTNVTNITYDNTTVVNQGPSYEELRAHSERPIERMRLEREANVDLNVAVTGPVVRGEVITVQAPIIAVGRPAQRPRTVKANIAQAVVEHGWEDVADRQAAEQARQKMKSEATPPPDAPSKTFVKPVVTESQTTTASATPAEKPSPAATASVTASRPQRLQTATVSPTPSAVPTSTAKPSVSQTAAESPRASVSPALVPGQRIKPVPTISRPLPPRMSPTASPSPAATVSERPQAGPATTPSPSATARPQQRLTPAPTITPTTQNVSPLATPVPGQRLTREQIEARMKEIQARRTGSPAATPKPPPTAVEKSTSTPPAKPSASPTPISTNDVSPSPKPKETEKAKSLPTPTPTPAVE